MRRGMTVIKAIHLKERLIFDLIRPKHHICSLQDFHPQLFVVIRSFVKEISNRSNGLIRRVIS